MRIDLTMLNFLIMLDNEEEGFSNVGILAMYLYSSTGMSDLQINNKIFLIRQRS